MRKESVRKGVEYIGSRFRKRRQKGRFLPVGAILRSLAGPALGALHGGKKTFGGKNDDCAAADKPRQKTLLRRRVTTKRLTLPNGQSFLCRYEVVSRKILPRNVTITRTQKVGPRRQRKRKTHQGGSLLGNRHLPQQVC